MQRLRFRQYLIFEQHEYLGHRVGDLLSAVQDLIDNQASISNRQMVRHAEQFVNQIRIIVHSNWPAEELQYLRKLQNIGVAIMRAIDEKDDLKEIMVSVSKALENVSGELKVPVNHLGTPNDDEGGKSPNQQPATEIPPATQPAPPPQAPPAA